MAHDFPPLLTTLAAGFTAAWVLGLVTQRLRLSPIVGYLLAGVLIGPHVLKLADTALAPQLAELGVVLMMFGVGLHFHLHDLLKVRWVAIPGALGQSAMATVAGALVFHFFGWPMTAGLVVGMAMAVASTVVLIRVLIDARKLNTPAGHVAVGWLIVEDILTVVALVMLPVLATPGAVASVQAMLPTAADAAAGASAGAASATDAAVTAAAGHGATPEAAAAVHHGTEGPWGWALDLAWAMGKLAIMVMLVMVGGSKVVPWILVRVARLRSRELFTLTVLVLSIAVATGTAVGFGASPALGAFLAGMVVAQSPVSQQAGSDALPMRDAFSVLFFVSVGMLFDPGMITREPLLLLGGMAIVMIVKPLAALVIVAVLGHPLTTGLTVALALAQIGEFSFILGESALKLKILTPDGFNVLVGCAIISITINPMLFRLVPTLERAARRSPLLWRLLNERSERHIRAGQELAQDVAEHVDPAHPLAVVVGYGPVGQQVDRLLREAGRQTIIVELSIDSVSALRSDGRAAIFGDASQTEVLVQAGVPSASHLILTTPHSPDLPALITAARQLNPSLRILMRTRYLREERVVSQLGANTIVVDEVESAVALVERVMEETGAAPEQIRTEAERVRHDLTAHERPSHM